LTNGLGQLQIDRLIILGPNGNGGSGWDAGAAETGGGRVGKEDVGLTKALEGADLRGEGLFASELPPSPALSVGEEQTRSVGGGDIRGGPVLGELREKAHAPKQVVPPGGLDEDIRVGSAIGDTQLVQQDSGPGELGGAQRCGSEIDELRRPSGTDEPNPGRKDSDSGK